MELRVTERMRRNEEMTKTTERKSETAAKPQSAQRQEPTGRLAASRRALAFLEEQNRQIQEQQARRQSRYADAMDGLSAQKKQLESMDKRLKVMNKCQRIAARIMAGDKVPPEDLQYLMTKDPSGYKLAMAQRKPKKDPKEYDSLLDEEDRKELTQPDGERIDVKGGGASEL